MKTFQILHGEMDTSSLLKLAELNAALEQFLHFIIDGYGDLWLIIKYILSNNWVCYLSYGTTIEKAFRFIISKKELFFEIWNVLYIKTLSILLRNVDEVTEHSIVIKRIIKKLKEAKQFINSVLVPQMNASNIGNLLFWQKAALAFRANAFKSKEKKTILS